MQSIYICEDDKKQLAYMSEVIANYIMIESLDMELSLASVNPLILLEAIRSEKASNAIYFLDIDLNHDMNGLDLAKEIRKVDDLGKIVFITTHAELAPVTFRYKVEAIDYIVKKTPEELQNRIIKILNVIGERQHLNSEVKRQYTFKVGSKMRSIALDNIIYFESLSQPHKVAIITTNGHYQFYESLKAIEKSHEEFIRVHKSFIANIMMIESVNQKEKIITFKNGLTCDLSVARAKEVRKRLEEMSIRP